MGGWSSWCNSCHDRSRGGSPWKVFPAVQPASYSCAFSCCSSPPNSAGLKSCNDARRSVPFTPPLVPELGLPPEILILSMASGTFMISHVNDPFFWIFGELAELTPSEVFRSNTLGNALMGVVSFLIVSGIYFFFY